MDDIIVEILKDIKAALLLPKPNGMPGERIRDYHAFIEATVMRKNGVSAPPVAGNP
jgi:hypothetical protein